MTQRLRYVLLPLLVLLLVLPGITAAAPLGEHPPEVPAAPIPPADLADPQIVGGRDARPGELPWQVALVLIPYTTSGNYYTGQFCGGSLISAEWVLTAAHCMVHARENIGVVGGLTDLSNPAAQTQFRTVSRIIIHPGFNAITFANDLALLQLSSAVVPDAELSPIRLAAAGDTFAGQRSLISGWGSIVAQDSSYSLPPSYPPRLQLTRVPIVDNTVCDAQLAVFLGSGAVLDSMLCAGPVDGGRDACQADSGGPLAVNSGDGWRLAGLVSFGVGCAQPGLAGVYTRVSSFLPWIRRYVDFTVRPTPEAVAACQALPDVAVSPQFIRLEAGGTAQIDVAVRNTNRAAYGTADLLLSLSDGLQAAAAPGGVTLGSRAAWQGLRLAVNETRSFSVTVTAAETLPTAPIFVVELYCGGQVQGRIDGVMLNDGQYAALSGGAAFSDDQPTGEAAEPPQEPPAPAEPAGAQLNAPLPQQLPDTAEPAGDQRRLLAAAAVGALLLSALLRWNRRRRRWYDRKNEDATSL